MAFFFQRFLISFHKQYTWPRCSRQTLIKRLIKTIYFNTKAQTLVFQVLYSCTDNENSFGLPGTRTAASEFCSTSRDSNSPLLRSSSSALLWKSQSDISVLYFQYQFITLFSFGHVYNEINLRLYLVQVDKFVYHQDDIL